jgi:hypothetical protein
VQTFCPFEKKDNKSSFAGGKEGLRSKKHPQLAVRGRYGIYGYAKANIIWICMHG